MGKVNSKRLVIISGAGLSTESGIRTFRTDTSSGKALWDSYDINEVCDLGSFRAGFHYLKNGDVPFGAVDDEGLDLYTKTHHFYNLRRKELGTVEPNAAHLAIGELYKKYSGQIVNFTTNVDDLLERSGIPREEVIHAHGYLREVLFKREKAYDPEILVDVGYEEFNQEDFYWAKPNVTFFGESAPFYRGEIDLFETLTKDDLVVVAGCSNTVIDFNWILFPQLHKGIKMAVVNPDINYLEQEAYQERGVLVYRCGAVEAFTNKHFLGMIEKHLQG